MNRNLMKHENVLLDVNVSQFLKFIPLDEFLAQIVAVFVNFIREVPVQSEHTSIVEVAPKTNGTSFIGYRK